MKLSWLLRWRTKEKTERPPDPPCDGCGDRSADRIPVRDIDGRDRTLCPACYANAAQTQARVWPWVVAIMALTLVGGGLVLAALGNVGSDARALLDVENERLRDSDVLRAAVVLSQGDAATHFAWLAFVAALVIAGAVGFESSMRRVETLASAAEQSRRRDLRQDVQIARQMRFQTNLGMFLMGLMCCLSAYAVAPLLLGACFELKIADECRPVQTWQVVASVSAGAVWVWLGTEIARIGTAYESSAGPLGTYIRAYGAARARRAREVTARRWGPAIGWMAGLTAGFLTLGIVLAALAGPSWPHVLAPWALATSAAVVLVIGARVVQFRLWSSGLNWLVTIVASFVVAGHLWVWGVLTFAVLQIGSSAMAFTVVGAGLLAGGWAALLLGLRDRGVARSLYRFNVIPTVRRRSARERSTELRGVA